MKKLALYTLLAVFACVLASAPANAAPNPDTAELEALLNQPEGAATEMEDLPLLELTAPEAAQKQAPACPTAVACSSGGGGPCALGINCVNSNLGACCKTAAGPTICCINGTIKVKTCPCAGIGCPTRQVTVQWCV